MKMIKILMICLSFFLFLSISFSCEKKQETNSESFLIKVDSIQVPNLIRVNESFDIKLYGILGTNGCYHFSEFKTEVQNNNIIIEAYGKVDKNSNICPTIIVYLENERLNYFISEKGFYTIKVKQPDNNYLEKLISIE